MEHDGRGEAQKFGLVPEPWGSECCGYPSRGCKRQQTASAKSRGVRKTERVGSRPWEVAFVAWFGMTPCSPNYFNMRLGERDNMKPIKELLQEVETQKSVDQHRPSKRSPFLIPRNSDRRITRPTRTRIDSCRRPNSKHAAILAFSCVLSPNGN